MKDCIGRCVLFPLVLLTIGAEVLPDPHEPISLNNGATLVLSTDPPFSKDNASKTQSPRDGTISIDNGTTLEHSSGLSMDNGTTLKHNTGPSLSKDMEAKTPSLRDGTISMDNGTTLKHSPGTSLSKDNETKIPSLSNGTISMENGTTLLPGGKSNDTAFLHSNHTEVLPSNETKIPSLSNGTISEWSIEEKTKGSSDGAAIRSVSQSGFAQNDSNSVILGMIDTVTSVVTIRETDKTESTTQLLANKDSLGNYINKTDITAIVNPDTSEDDVQDNAMENVHEISVETVEVLPHSDVEDNARLRADINPITAEKMTPSLKNESGIEIPSVILAPRISESTSDVALSMSAVSWLDSFIVNHRNSFWVTLNTVFMGAWIILGFFAIYRLLGLPLASIFVSRTRYLIIHLLIFTAATFEFVHLVHLSYGSEEGLPLFLTLLLSHTPTPCLAGAVILMVHCIFGAARVPMFRSYFPPLVYVGILISFVILLSFVGDIIVGVSHSSSFLLFYRLFLNSLCVSWFAIFIFHYRKIVNIGHQLRKEYFIELNSFAHNADDLCEPRVLLKEFLVLWSHVTLLSCLCGICMCVCCFSMSIFFTVSYVPLWAFWTLHASIFVSQSVLLISLTFGASLTLVDNSERNIFVKYFLPAPPDRGNINNSIIKRGNFIYQRVPLVNGPCNIPTADIITLETEEVSLMPNNYILPELLSTSSFKPRVNLKRSATFNCTPSAMSPTESSTPIHPVLSEHLLPRANPSSEPDTNHCSSEDPNEASCSGALFCKQNRPINCRISPMEFELPCGYISPSRRYYGYRRYGSLRRVPYGHAQFMNHKSILLPAQQPSNPGVVQGALTDGFNSSPKPEPPEKPLRKTEPVLVKGVIRESGVIESARFGFGPLMNETTEKDLNLCNEDTEYSPKPFRPNLFYDKNIKPLVSPHKSVEKGSDDFPMAYAYGGRPEFNLYQPFYTFSRVRNPDLDVNSAPYKAPIEMNELCSSSSVDRRTSNVQSEKSFASTMSSKGFKNSIESFNQNGIMDSDNCSDSTLRETSSLSTSNADVSPCIPSSEKRTSLRRNHSTASYEMEASNCVNQKASHTWYDTWTGRRSKRKCIRPRGREMVDEDMKLGGSRNSISSLYGRLRPKRSKSLYQTNNSKDDKDGGREKEESKSLQFSIDPPPEEDADEFFLPRLTEELDLESEILNSSTTLANFYSLKRSDLKKRKRAIADGEIQNGLEEPREAVTLLDSLTSKEEIAVTA